MDYSNSDGITLKDGEIYDFMLQSNSYGYTDFYSMQVVIA